MPPEARADLVMTQAHLTRLSVPDEDSDQTLLVWLAKRGFHDVLALRADSGFEVGGKVVAKIFQGTGKGTRARWRKGAGGGEGQGEGGRGHYASSCPAAVVNCRYVLSRGAPTVLRRRSLRMSFEGLRIIVL